VSNKKARIVYKPVEVLQKKGRKGGNADILNNGKKKRSTDSRHAPKLRMNAINRQKIPF
jgi:hypothetical protein